MIAHGLGDLPGFAGRGRSSCGPDGAVGAAGAGTSPLLIWTSLTMASSLSASCLQV
jgi:hypothetical protein